MIVKIEQWIPYITTSYQEDERTILDLSFVLFSTDEMRVVVSLDEEELIKLKRQLDNL